MATKAIVLNIKILFINAVSIWLENPGQPNNKKCAGCLKRVGGGVYC